MKKKRHAEHANHERWLVSYADFITLLFAFFVVLYASSQVDKKKAANMAAAIESAFHQLGVFPGSHPGPPLPNQPPSVSAAGQLKPISAPPTAQPPGLGKGNGASGSAQALRRQLEIALAKEVTEHKIVLRIGPDGLIISLTEVGFFDSGSAELRNEAKPVFARLAEIVLRQPAMIRVEGHTDNVPIHTAQFASNWDLSTARAANLVKLLIAQYRCAPERLSATGFAEFRPVASNATAEGRQQNRRVDLVVVAGAAAATPPQTVLPGHD